MENTLGIADVVTGASGFDLLLKAVRAAVQGGSRCSGLKDIASGKYRDDLEAVLGGVLLSLAEDAEGRASGFVNRFGMTPFLKEHKCLFRMLSEDENRALLLDVCVAYLDSCDWDKCKSQCESKLSGLRERCENVGGLSVNVFSFGIMDLVPLVCFCMFKDMSVGERLLLKKMCSLEENMEKIISLLSSKIEYMGDFVSSGDGVRFEKELARSYAFFNYIDVFMDSDVVCVIESMLGCDHGNYLSDLDSYLLRTDLENVLDDIFSTLDSLIDIKTIKVSSELVVSIKKFVLSVLVIKSGFVGRGRYATDHNSKGMKFDCLYRSKTFLDLDAMMSPVLEKQFNPDRIDTYYYEFLDIESGICRRSKDGEVLKDAKISSVFRALNTSDYDVDMLSERDKWSVEHYDKLFSRTRGGVPKNFYFMVFADGIRDDVSKVINDIFPHLVVINKNDSDMALTLGSDKIWDKIEIEFNTLFGETYGKWI